MSGEVERTAGAYYDEKIFEAELVRLPEHWPVEFKMMLRYLERFIAPGWLVAEAGVSRPFRAILDMEDPAFFAPEDPQAAVAAYLRRTGQPGDLARGELVRAQLEGLALLYRRTVEELRGATGATPDAVSMVGGGCRNRLFCQLVADGTGLPVAAGPVEATATGNLGLQMVATGDLAGPPDVRALAGRSFPPERYEPRRSPGWDEAYGRYLGIRAAPRAAPRP